MMRAYMEHLIKRSVPFSFFMIDVDNFKSVNDTFGHLTGDLVLKDTAEYVVGKVGDLGVVGRYGGDEFMVVLEGIQEYKDIWNLGHSINMDISKLKVEGVKGVHVTLTMGISRFPLDAKDYTSILNFADKALYRGKMKGRNCFIIYLESKHKNIDIKAARDTRLSTTHVCSNVFTYLTENDSVEKNILNLFKQMAAYFMFDHVCVEGSSGMNFEVLHPLAKTKHFTHVSIDDIDKSANNIGMVNISKLAALDPEGYGPLIEQLQDQNESAALLCRITAYGTDFGYIRVDMTDTGRVWQANEMDIVMVAAKAIAIILYYQNKKLEDFEVTVPVTLGSSTSDKKHI
jgi:diguanylate cyclase (GGDEF)-like protein